MYQCFVLCGGTKETEEYFEHFVSGVDRFAITTRLFRPHGRSDDVYVTVSRCFVVEFDLFCYKI